MWFACIPSPFHGTFFAHDGPPTSSLFPSGFLTTLPSRLFLCGCPWRRGEGEACVCVWRGGRGPVLHAAMVVTVSRAVVHFLPIPPPPSPLYLSACVLRRFGCFLLLPSSKRVHLPFPFSTGLRVGRRRSSNSSMRVGVSAPLHVCMKPFMCGSYKGGERHPPMSVWPWAHAVGGSLFGSGSSPNSPLRSLPY